MRLDDQLGGDAGLALQTVDILGEEVKEEALGCEQSDEDVGDGGVELSGVELLGEHVEGFGPLTKVADVKDGFGIWQVEASKVGVETSVGGAKIRYCGIR